MATKMDTEELDLQEQLTRIRKMIAESDRHMAERDKLTADTRYGPATLLFQGLIATAALLGAGAALTKLFFP